MILYLKLVLSLALIVAAGVCGCMTWVSATKYKDVFSLPARIAWASTFFVFGNVPVLVLVALWSGQIF
jgi:hypothetical protein